MLHHVNCPGLGIGEVSAADVTLIEGATQRIHGVARMHCHVFGEVRRASELLGAQATFKRFLFCVNKLMSLQALFGHEDLSTDLTRDSLALFYCRLTVTVIRPST